MHDKTKKRHIPYQEEIRYCHGNEGDPYNNKIRESSCKEFYANTLHYLILQYGIGYYRNSTYGCKNPNKSEKVPIHFWCQTVSLHIDN